MHLIYMNDNPKYKWGYKECYEDVILANEVGIIAEQHDSETREEFFKRVGNKPKKDMYGSDEKKDTDVLCDDCYCRNEIASRGYALDKLLYDEDWFVRAEVARQGYKLDILVLDEEATVRKSVAA